MDQNYDDDEINLREYLDVLLKRWVLVVFTAFVFVLFAFFLSVRQKPVYEASATVLLRGSQSSVSQYAGIAGALGINLSGGGNIAELQELLKSKAVAAKVLKDLDLVHRIKGWDDPGIETRTLISSVSGMLLPPDSSGNVLQIKAAAFDPQLAADVANGFVNALSYYWNELNYTEAHKKLDYIKAELPRVEEELKNIEDKLKLVPRGATGFSFSGQSGIQRDYEIYNSVYTMLKKELEATKLEASKELSPFSVLDPAEKPLGRSKPKIKLNLMIGFVVGLFTGVFVVFFREYWKKSNI
ncbi:hypothetical protein A2230_08445 [candidate division WOR-1 bacterium RIFOXYA2_FULL_36_21]|uniref:Polysaccharide chain length determinant N-terminal domain-containing protein n=1 Tax=candidate division WOR-1 bacterium RIFOXYB2_FULL_36_35 TaxID=1802578 RepID=A0A1F4S8E0_UNCSA|nr:MAG: hypothetical protein A2230_08445 [candidate division WOR-1 bacterium RIFOXYA2_FULL_36_21]OGC15337.1 MAG: hypothetical protein A2282_06195 [candidate division WOR-1 bacterium RIFOXYA12_FULL_36_13]OGC16679.1 MAG: hypothetical protein A2290_03660 [candidate division WOR-1 bacterium RIFOXYB2_FULL_36_35]